MVTRRHGEAVSPQMLGTMTKRFESLIMGIDQVGLLILVDVMRKDFEIVSACLGARMPSAWLVHMISSNGDETISPKLDAPLPILRVRIRVCSKSDLEQRPPMKDYMPSSEEGKGEFGGAERGRYATQL